MNNLSQYKLLRDAVGNASANDAAPIDSGKNRGCKRGSTNAFYDSLSATLCYYFK
ncbi:hypothetical protein JHK86_018696 [Glycine max]|nr:hypothetical protein JHK86_018696 [Glycine max]